MTYTDMTKGKLNRLKIGQKVRALPKLVDWHASHLCWSYGVRVTEDTSYGEHEKEIELDSLPQVYIWALAKLSGKRPMGIVTHYGSDGDWDDKKKQNIRERKCVYVEFTFKTELGNLKYGTYVSEKDLEAVKKR